MNDCYKNHITVKNFIYFVTPSVAMMLVIALYSIIDGIFVANWIGPDALAAVGLMYPISGVMFGFSIMMATGASALAAIKLGEKKFEEACEKFTMITVAGAVIGVVFTIGGIVLLNDFVRVFGVTGRIHDYCIAYGMIMVLGTPFIFISTIFEYFIRVDGKPGFTLVLYITGGVVNIILDYILIVVFETGIIGAGIATVAGLAVAAILGGWYFLYGRPVLKFMAFKFDGRFIMRSLVNGFPEMATESSASVTAIMINMIMLKLAGGDGVAALSAVMYIHYFMVSVYLGYILGVSPLISYHYGAKEYHVNKKIIRYSRTFILTTSVLVFLIAELMAPVVIQIFLDPTSNAYIVAVKGFRIVACCFPFIGINVFVSGLFTAYANGNISTIVALSRGLAFVVVGTAVLPIFFDINGIWMTMPFAESMTLFLSVYIIRRYREKYQY